IGSLLLAIALHTFMQFELNLVEMLAAMLAIMIIALIGTYDDLFSMRQSIKAVLPMAAAVPLIAVEITGGTIMFLPFIGAVDFGIYYTILLIPLGITVAANLTNMLAGFNGMEAGMGVVIFATTLFLAVQNGSIEMALLSAAMLGALIAFLRFNWFPARVFTGDIGNLAIGATLAVAVILGNLRVAGAILVVPYVIDFFIKAANKFPSSKWWGEPGAGGKLYPVDGKVRGFAQWIMRKFKGVSEQKLVLTFIAIEAACAIVAILIYGKVLG
ncbi:MAG: hypothetical protein NTV88_03615, partial [Candidatus Micrarchaeota archaeon]|nr:hypothetical protein [Candidatus Micrarchaeota archaeon]